ncbi:tbc1 domain family member 5 q92609 [Plasmopara halstedii]|uniref:Tbc1 domain family member 5 q92609 n=1 Tax=Plasmopara halstedii TaxID=4781 RepID=A0A0P1AFN6_PLAHL|nr:tbc1 domain family member 5 q92609 [Plasmopara halstedii]CEG39602.1 tbc1 domain family member 5 q92609 [Plasmopara halstedii]|eukprot:XP_024575971.1 tbc1 domain family member 5 q92609 [Plasmopara halstedii]
MAKFKVGTLLLEVGNPPEWKSFEVLLAGSSTADLGLYYYPDGTSTMPLGCIRLQSAHIDSLEDVLMVVTNDKTWFLCASSRHDASDWNDAICNAVKRLSNEQTHHQRSYEISTCKLSDMQSRDSEARVEYFLNFFVQSTVEDLSLKAVEGKFSQSCMRSLVWKVWLDYLPKNVPFNQWLKIAREKRLGYERKRCQHLLFKNLCAVKQRPEDFLTLCETSTNSLLYNIYKDVRRTHGELPFFRDPFVQCVMIRVLYIYSITHSEISYNQGMGDLLATLLYLLHIEQWPLNDYSCNVIAKQYDASRSSDSNLSARKNYEDGTFSEAYMSCNSENSHCDSFFRSQPFSGSSNHFQQCCRKAAGYIVRELTLSEFIEHDAYLLLEKMMVRMAGTYCPRISISSQMSEPQIDKPLSSADQLPVLPLDHQMNRVHYQVLSQFDPQTAECLVKLGVEPQIFLLRWIRVLMAREFEMQHVWQIWDAIFSLTPSDFSFINVLCVAIVLELRDEILAAEDATTVLLCLRNISDHIKGTRLVDSARELYDALLIATAIKTSMKPK